MKADETLFIDDSKANVEGAERAGLKGLYLAPGQTILDLNFDMSHTAMN